jgi:hypothetical protein
MLENRSFSVVTWFGCLKNLAMSVVQGILKHDTWSLCKPRALRSPSPEHEYTPLHIYLTVPSSRLLLAFIDN